MLSVALLDLYFCHSEWKDLQEAISRLKVAGKAMVHVWVIIFPERLGSNVDPHLMVMFARICGALEPQATISLCTVPCQDN